MKRADIVKKIKDHHMAKGERITGLPSMKKHELAEMMSMLETHKEDSDDENKKKGEEDERLAAQIMEMKKDIEELKKARSQ